MYMYSVLLFPEQGVGVAESGTEQQGGENKSEETREGGANSEEERETTVETSILL